MIVRINIEDATPAILLALAAAMGSSCGVTVVDDNQKPANPDAHPSHAPVLTGMVPELAAPYTSPVPVPGYQSQGNPDEFNPNVAASIFGAQTPPNVPAPAVTGATAHPFVANQPAASAAGGTPGGAEVDSAGYPYDARIHSSSREKLVKDGTWKLKRGVDQTLVANVRAATNLELAAPNAPVTRFNDQPVAQYNPGAGVQTLPQVAAAAIGGYTPPPVNVGPTYGDVVGKITSLAASGKVPALTSKGLLDHLGIADMQALAGHSDKWAFIVSELDRLAGGA